MTVPIIDPMAANAILFVMDGSFSRFVKEFKGACVAKERGGKIEAVAKAVFAFFQAEQEVRCGLSHMQMMKMWVFSIFTNSEMELDQPDLCDFNMKQWTRTACESLLISPTICDAFKRAFEKAARQQIAHFDRKMSSEEGFVDDLRGVELEQLEELVQPQAVVQEESVFIERPIVTKEAWRAVVDPLKKDPLLLL